MLFLHSFSMVLIVVYHVTLKNYNTPSSYLVLSRAYYRNLGLVHETSSSEDDRESRTHAPALHIVLTRTRASLLWYVASG